MSSWLETQNRHSKGAAAERPFSRDDKSIHFLNTRDHSSREGKNDQSILQHRHHQRDKETALTCRKVRLMASIIKISAVHTLQLFLCFILSERWSSYFICGHQEPAKKHSMGWSEALIPLPVEWSLGLLIQLLACGWGTALASPHGSCACRYGSHRIGNKAKAYQHFLILEM